MRELAYALRRLRNNPLFTIAATLTLAIAIGATASVFGLVDGVLLKAFPYREPDRVVTLWESNPQGQQPKAAVATANYFDWAKQNETFTTLAAACCGSFLRFTVMGPEEAERVIGLAVTPSYFAALGLTPVLGRGMSADTSAAPEVVISYGYWQRQFGGSPTVLGRTLTIDNPNDARPTRQHIYTIVGVMPPGIPGPIDLWVRIYFEPQESTLRDGRYLDVYGRLKPGVTVETAQRDLATIAARLAVAYPKTNAGWSVQAVPLIDQLVGPVRPALVMLFAAAACVLLIGAANLANLFLVRCLAREREMALRTALGATRGRLVRDLTIEAGVLTAAAGALGVAVAVVGVRALRALAPASLPRLDQVGVDGRVIAFCALASIATVFVFGLLPAWHVSRGTLAEALKEGGRGTGSAQQHRLQNGLVVLQVAVALVLLTGAGLLVESFVRFQRMDPGFRSAGVLTAQIAFTAERYPTAERQQQFLQTLIERLAAQPGTEAASVSGGVPGWTVRAGIPLDVVGDPAPDPSHKPVSLFNAASPDYFRAMGIRLLRGRGLLATDDAHAPKVAVIDALLAKRFFDGRDPIGRQLVFGIGWSPDTARIVGVVASTKENGLAADDIPQTYMPVMQLLGARAVQAFVVVRTLGDPHSHIRTLKRTIASLDPNVPVSDIRTMSDRMMQSVATTRFSTFLASLFAVVALVLGVVGIYSVLAYVVSQRRREIAVRIALGATHSDVMADVLRQALMLTAVGLALGSAAAWLLTRALSNLFLGVSPHDPFIFIGGAAIFAIVALAASSVPALRTTRVNPASALVSS
jgi:putative ABC transport system permease protein